MPKARHLSTAADTAMTWAATTSFSDLPVEEEGPRERTSQSRRVRALSMVSAVVKVLETTTTCDRVCVCWGGVGVVVRGKGRGQRGR